MNELMKEAAQIADRLRSRPDLRSEVISTLIATCLPATAGAVEVLVSDAIDLQRRGFVQDPLALAADIMGKVCS